MYAQIIIDIASSAIDKVFTYHVPPALGLEVGHHVLVPFGRGDTPKEGFVLNLVDSTELPSCKDILKIIEPYPILLPSQIELCRWMQQTYRCLTVDALRLMIPSQLRGSKVKEKREKTVQLAPDLDVQAAVCSCRSPMQRELLTFLSQSNAEFSVRDIGAFYPNCSAAINALIKKGWVISNQHTVFRRPLTHTMQEKQHELTKAQLSLSKRVSASIGKSHDVFLLHGVTGSGKTEVYLECIAHCLSMGLRAIVLVPEIALTPQTVSRFQSRFGDEIAILHSKLSHGERFDEWRRIRLGTAKIVIGARSAIFAPIDNLGLIVIDEEHEGSYQSEMSPRYHATEVALHRAKAQNSVLLMGSATPSLMSYYRAESGRYTLLELPDRVMNRPLPSVKLVDMREEFINGNTGIFSGSLIRELENCFSQNKQAMLFINRRGYSSFVSCRACGYVEKCENCDISMTYHKSLNKMKCHYCGAIAPLPKECPSCHKSFLKQIGIGTEQVEEALNALFPNVKCLRLDTDTASRKGSMGNILKDFSDGKAQVLIGTQMIAKGHDFPNVTLVGVILADTTLNLPDFRAGERTFQLLTQVAGRAGRDVSKGRVVIQTCSPTNPIVKFAQSQDYRRFYQYEIAERKKGLYPPFSIFVRLLFRSDDEKKLHSFGADFAKELEALLVNRKRALTVRDLLLLTATPSPVSMIQGQYRYQIVIKLLRTKEIPSALSVIYAACAEKCREFIPNIEINPQDMF